MYLPIEHRVVRCASSDLPLRVPLPDGGFVLIRRGQRHPVLGEVDEIADHAGNPLTVCGRIEWANPSHIPALWNPRLLPLGAGSAILNAISKAQARPLRYRGPYPTAALFESLAACFRTEATLDDFIVDADAATVLGQSVEPAALFVPAPFVRTMRGPVCAQVRDGVLEEAFILGKRFSRSAASGRRLVTEGAATLAVLELGGTRHAKVATLDSGGAPLKAISPPAPIRSSMLGQPIPSAIANAIWEALLATAPRLLAAALRTVSIATPIVWDDCQLEACVARGPSIALHIGYGEASASGPELLREFTDVVRPLAHRFAQRHADASALSATSPAGAGS